jgi:glycosyltransferase involved in cell wall biosynthesis
LIRKQDVCVLIPAYNEEKNIGRIVSEVLSLGFKPVVVDDGSTDSTAQKVRLLKADCVVSRVNEGKGAAIQRGFDWFLKERYDALIVMDADGQHRAQELDRFVAALHEGRGDLIVGNRMANPVGMSWIRVLTNRFMSFLISWAAGQAIPDSQCGYRALTRKAVLNVRLETKRFEAESEMLLRAARAGLKIESMPIESVYRDEISHIRPARDTLRFFRFFFKYLIFKS